MSASVRNREEYWRARTARDAYRCDSVHFDRCPNGIDRGDRYVEMTLPPSAEFANGEWHRMRACVPCAFDFNAELAAQVLARRPWTPDEKTATGTRITVKRACNGCGTLIGDVTEAEIEAAIGGARMTDVRGECARCSSAGVVAA